MIRFGPSGNSESFYLEGNKTSIEAPKWLKSKGLNAYEYSFGRGFTSGYETAKKLGSEAVANDVLVSVHAPYYINFANIEDTAKEKNINYVINSLKFLQFFNGKKCVFHPGSCGKMTRTEAFNNVLKSMDSLLEEYYKNNFEGLFICPETMGKTQQIGSVDEIIKMCELDKCLIPTFDFGHINAVTNGGLKTKDDYKRILDKTFNRLGDFKAKNFHVHFSKIEYSAKGEVKHLTLDDTIYGPQFEPLAELLDELNLTPTIICESKSQMCEDAMKLKSIYENIRRK